MPEPLVGFGQSLRARAVERRRRQVRAALVVLLLLAVAVFAGGISWGLPSREADQFLFATRSAWTGKQILEIAGPRIADANQGADIDRDPLVRLEKVTLNRTDAERARIVRRYRLFTNQPDEMVTLMALAQMRPGQGDFDPRLYQYGGLWVYPVGALIRAAGTLRLLHVTSDLEYYLDHPEAFGRFYVIVRLYVVGWAIVGAWAVFALVRRWTRGSLRASCIACCCYIMLPAVVNMSHEAKPHLPGAVLMLLTVLAASKYVRTTELIWWLVSAVLAGLAVGMVLAAWPVMLVLPIAVMLVRQGWPTRARLLAVGVGLEVAVYFAVNPYVLMHLFDNRTLLRSNLGNTRDMFQLCLSGQGLANAAVLIGEGSTVAVAVCGGFALVLLAVAAICRKHWAMHHSCWLMVGPAMLVLAQFILFADGQPGEYGRFAIFLDISLLTAAIVGGTAILNRMQWRATPLVLLAVLTAFSGSRYYQGFISEATGTTSRLVASRLIEEYRLAGARTIGVVAEPAPYSVPPLDLFAWRLVLLPKGYDPASDPRPPEVIVRTVDVPTLPKSVPARYECTIVDPVAQVRRMQWAAKPLLIMHVKPQARLGR